MPKGDWAGPVDVTNAENDPGYIEARKIRRANGAFIIIEGAE